MERKVVLGEERVTDEVDVGQATVAEGFGDFAVLGKLGSGIGECLLVEIGRGFVGRLREDADELDDKGNHQREACGEWGESAGAFFLILEVEQHDDEQEEHHHRAGIDEDLDDPDKEGAEADEKPCKADEAGNHRERA